ncbi:uncharacterized protein BDZ99DRAFT_32300 [Mytilinidion resinicola]|uniref:Uncharacterized protein n=1 Tax=Mytilinidion resinicola TaxID=574789 RepID=A0A6A6YL38_9PEZI|nr:uncharacterized protein BDZ99DRAFT_32300 [Mytilinidion resinicola]KAF2809592.1 hypothetical protein BDZ99DRAFT_32300 [Mytilinidion resinicola]
MRSKGTIKVASSLLGYFVNVYMLTRVGRLGLFGTGGSWLVILENASAKQRTLPHVGCI